MKGPPECTPATCGSAGAECGRLDDGCGGTLDCGGCAAAATCEANRCGAACTETDAELCARLGVACGPLDATDSCGQARHLASCGSCAAGTCGGMGSAGQCGCTAESDAQLCTHFGKTCGQLVAVDSCGESRTVASCGSCLAPETCGGSGVANVCGQPDCMLESDAAFCARFGRRCGAHADVDNCGHMRTVASCGSCDSPQTCGGGGTPGVCGCASESDAVFCSRLGKGCGQVTGTDSCGQRRTVASCGTCTAPQTCGAANVCGCSETDAAFCARLGASCGSVTAPDACGVMRTVASCGTCTAPQTCGAANVCGCSETDAAFCARLGASCGSVTASDHCGVTRTVGCGTCSAPQTCGGGGMANACGGYTEPMSPVCGGGFCWENPLPVGSYLRGAKTSPSGSNWVVGEAGTVLVWNGATWRGWFAVTNAHLQAVWPFSDTDVWAVGTGGSIVHFDGVAFTSVASGVQADLKGAWGAPDGTLWVVGAGGTVLKRAPGGSFVKMSPSTSANLNAVFGVGSDVWMVGASTIVRWNGASFSTTSAPWELTDVWGASQSDIWAVSPFGTMRYTGAGWLQSTAAKGSAVFGSGAADVWVVDYTYTTQGAYHFDGLSWTARAIDTGTFGNSLRALTGASSDTLLAAGEHGVLYRYDGQRWWRIDQGVPAEGGDLITYLGNLVLGGGAAVVGGQAQVGSFSWTGVLLTRDAQGRWSRSLRPQTTPLRGTGPSNLWSAASKIAQRWDGATWKASTFSTTSLTPVDVAPLSPTDAWVVGKDQTLRWNGVSWTAVPNPVGGTASTLSTVMAADSNLVWAGGSGGTILVWNGTAWEATASGVTGKIAGFAGFGSNLGNAVAYAWGDFGVLKWGGSMTGWLPTARTTQTFKVWPETATTYWVAGPSELKRWDPIRSAYDDMAPWLAGASFSLYDVAGAGGQLFVTGSYTEILRRQ